ncbi:hypothetical protein C8Q77DRAFT_1136721 [Trametes polyzona]|nr:hypothetical protein C8Q77DRAFT_1136721 [Trametes polyzona]
MLSSRPMEHGMPDDSKTVAVDSDANLNAGRACGVIITDKCEQLSNPVDRLIVEGTYPGPPFIELIGLPYSLWDAYRETFRNKLGITLTNRVRHWYWAISEQSTDSELPYANRCSHVEPTDDLFLQDRFASGFDAKQRNVIVKTIVKDSPEEQINVYLSQCGELYDRRAFACVLPPIAIVRTPHRFSFLVTPLWGYRFCTDYVDTVQGVMDFIRCMLTGLSFLHEHRIAHRDIHDGNILADWYCYHSFEEDIRQQEFRRHLRSKSISYALYDFNLSLQLPPGTSLKTCRRPACEGFLGMAIYHPDDIYLGQPYYNPFAYDVGCLGFMFVHNLTDAISAVPMLAPLFGKMTTHIVDERFTAAEALEFFRRVEAETSPETLKSSITLQPNYHRMHDPQLYWCHTSPEFQSMWNSHRPPPFSWRLRLLRWIGSITYGFEVIAFVRRILDV